MPSAEIRTTLLLAALFSFRLLGLFMILPVFTLYAGEYEHTTPLLIGTAIGIYGLTQALCQLPLGFFSDRFGRKPILLFGLSLFALGSLFAGLAHQISSVIVGRALQGAGAIGSTILATASDLTSEQHRPKAMALIGITIGVTFSLAMVLGPVIAAHYHLSGIFFVSLALALFGMLLTLRLPALPAYRTTSFWTQFKYTLTPTILFFDLSIFLLHTLLTANFIVIPLVLLNHLHIPKAQQWSVYIPVLVLSAIFMSFLLRKSNQPAQTKRIFRLAIYLLCLSQLGMTLFHHHLFALLISLLIFFTAFNLLEALLPALISQLAPPAARGTTLGIYSTCQFLGIFVGGFLGGLLYGQFSTIGVFLFGLVITLLWLPLLLFIFIPPGELHGKRHQ